MPRYNGLNTERLESLARRLLGIRQGGIMPALSPEPAVSINLPETLDLFALSGNVPWGWAQQVAAGGAGTYGAFALSNQSADLIVTADVWIGASTMSLNFCALGPAGILGLAAAGAGQIGWRDSRRALASFPLSTGAITLGAGTLAAVPPAGYFVCGGCTAASTMEFAGSFVLAPGASLAAWNTTANLAQYFKVQGFIRSALPDELEAL